MKPLKKTFDGRKQLKKEGKWERLQIETTKKPFQTANYYYYGNERTFRYEQNK